MPRIHLLVILTSLFIAIVSFLSNDSYGMAGGLLLATMVTVAWYWSAQFLVIFMLAVAALIMLSYSTGEYAPFMRFMAVLVLMATVFSWGVGAPRQKPQPPQ